MHKPTNRADRADARCVANLPDGPPPAGQCGRGLIAMWSGYSAFSIASALETSTWLGTCSTLSALTVPFSTSIE